jgi:aspartyl protease
MTAFTFLAYATLTAMSLPMLHAEPPCPGNVDSLRLPVASRSRIVVPVEINHAGPYNFLLDTGAQVTMVDPTLATELNLKIQGGAEFGGVGFLKHASLAQVDLLKAGSKSVANHLVLVQKLDGFKADGLPIRGVIGGNFLGHFNVLIDYAHRMLCLDDANRMQSEVKGERIALANMPQTSEELPGTMPLVVPVRVPRAGTRPLLLKLDSGSNVTFIYDPDKCLALGLQKGARLQGNSADGAQRAFAMLPPQDLQIGKHTLPQVPLVRLVANGRDIPAHEVDGLLTTGLFRSVFISYADHFVVLDPW